MFIPKISNSVNTSSAIEGNSTSQNPFYWSPVEVQWSRTTIFASMIILRLVASSGAPPAMSLVDTFGN